ncbi:hypothetical protein CDV50_12860 [Haematobacter massiliensis]|uniref:Uncharacterized protein n=1 Tax=Haematobacter massiliensis TaxID=195105 RepID=A0A086Y7T3_9RHOB|nr:hypothetical protein [Haematobacter massiliensis]KFI30333.1 hypothetical protein CN97_12130 [Haematobacter massiliensis]OWJ70520.1 hypothetical protein CDV50_12860 [Haematobacter massiliensis]OWJ87340.1 hypothetical protein CDV51_06255 [Haematobacter massiliensis]QBJ24792.1 hypothetical protein HmaOT1_11360 [Haematobacter massiliensis]
MTRTYLVAGLLCVSVVAACGNTRGQRIATGAVGGAAAGQVIADEPLAGAAVGGLVGAVR